MSSESLDVVSGASDRVLGVAPKLRFPEFQHAEVWESRKLRELLFEPKKRNRDLKFGPEHVLSVSGEHGCVNQIQFMGRSYAGVSVKDYHVVRTGDIVYTKSPLKAAPYGIIKANKGEDGIVSTLYAVYRPTAEASADYIDHYFSSNYNLNSYLQPLVKKGPKNDMKVSNSEVLTGTIYAPPKPEQQKIAACLSSIDTLIAAERERLTALKDHKKGLIQQLLPAEGKTKPRLRFPEFIEAGEWQCKPLKRLGQFFRGLTYSSDDVSEQGLLVIRSTNIQDGILRLDRDLVFVDRSCPEENRIRKGDIAICMSNGSRQLVGKSAQALEQPDAMATVGAFCSIFRPASPLAKYVLQSPRYFEFVARTIGGGGGSISNLRNQDLEEFQHPVPGLPSEERKIADCLLSVDGLIAAQLGRLRLLERHKQGLMQQLFPPLTGRVA